MQSLRTDLLRGRRSTQSFLEELRRGGRRWPAAAFCLAGAVPRASWRSCGAVAAAGPRLPFAWQPAVHRHRAWRGRRNTQSSTAHHKSSQLHFWQVHFSSQLITTYHIPTHHSSTSHTSLLTAPLSHRNFSSHLITTYPITAPLLTPLLTPHLSHQNSSQLHFSHLTSQVHFSHLTSHTSPKFTLKSYIHKGLTCGVIRSFYFHSHVNFCVYP